MGVSVQGVSVRVYGVSGRVSISVKEIGVPQAAPHTESVVVIGVSVSVGVGPG